ncbi:MAG: hypothetical protein DRP09_17590 [Candidatus Thorarchaeota archaeon]|nr:MAG: hypothetical protein DRP09_17590 [Candidatus Thorarchaeota archaeon]
MPQCLHDQEGRGLRTESTPSDSLEDRQVQPETSPFRQATAKWIDPVTGQFRPRVMRVRSNSKNQRNILETVYGCTGALTNDGHGCPWGCYAVFTCKKLGADFATPVPQTLDRRVLLRDLRRVRQDWVRIGIMGDPCFAWTTTVEACEVVRESEKTPVVISRFWVPPSDDELRTLAKAGAVLHGSICALDSDSFLGPRVRVCQDYLRWGGRFVWRVVTFHFDDTTQTGLDLWDRQDHLMSGDFGGIDDLRPLVLETPARLMKGRKQRNPTWDHLGEWAYFKAPTTRDHRFTPHNHNWTAGVLYPERDACWVGCRKCTVQCLVPQNGEDSATLEDFLEW